MELREKKQQTVSSVNHSFFRFDEGLTLDEIWSVVVHSPGLEASEETSQALSPPHPSPSPHSHPACWRYCAAQSGAVWCSPRRRRLRSPRGFAPCRAGLDPDCIWWTRQSAHVALGPWVRGRWSPLQLSKPGKGKRIQPRPPVSQSVRQSINQSGQLVY